MNRNCLMSRKTGPFMPGSAALLSCACSRSRSASLNQSVDRSGICDSSFFSVNTAIKVMKVYVKIPGITPLIPFNGITLLVLIYFQCRCNLLPGKVDQSPACRSGRRSLAGERSVVDLCIVYIVHFLFIFCKPTSGHYADGSAVG